ncbi:MAG: hypothetical protein P4L57_07385 [Rhizomicrobium sp.]|nr:hypothetical protein [Rhizomicrobium sp.]
MADTCWSLLKELFEFNMNFTPTAAEIEQFEADLCMVSPSLMRASLLEIRATNPVASGRARDWRDAIYRVYNRKVAEHAQLFPLFHSFETAMRSTVAVRLEAHYQEAKWWLPFSELVRRGEANPKSVKTVGGVLITADAAKSVYFLVSSLYEKKTNPAQINNGYDLLEQVPLSHLSALIEKHWSIFGGCFVLRGKKFSWADFSSRFERVRVARNTVYHHRSYAGFSDLYSAAEELLACLNFPLAKVHRRIAASRCTAPSYVPLLP